MPKKSAPKQAPKSQDQALLAKYEKHQSMASKHRAHADLIEAKLRTQGKRLGYEHDKSSPYDGPSKRKIVEDK